MLMAQLTVKSGNVVHTYELIDGKPLFAGRTAECDICLPSPAVSRRHAVFLARNGHCGLKDLDSSNGTYLNGSRITKSTRLKDGDIVQIAGFIIELQTVPATPYGDADQTAVFAGAGRAAAPRVPEPEASDSEPAVFSEETPPAFPPEPPTSSGLSDETVGHREDVAINGLMAEELDAAANDAPNRDEPPVAVAPSKPATAVVARQPSISSRMNISEEEVGDGADDAAFVMEEEPSADEGDREMALAKAAAEAGLVGEFTPDVEEDATAASEASDPMGLTASIGIDMPEAFEPDPDAIPIDDQFRQAIETRLLFYSFLADLKSERAGFIAGRPGLADPVKAELARQDRELDKIPTPEQAENMIEKRRAKQRELLRKIREAKAAGEPPPPKPSRAMREAEEMAIMQWTICAQSAREALPAAYGEGYRLVRDEPLAAMLEAVGVDPMMLMGGGAYLLALEVMLEEAKYNRVHVRVKMAEKASSENRRPAKPRGVFGLFGRNGGGDEESADVPEGESLEELAAIEEQLAARIAWINQEAAFLEKALIVEFWRVYTEAALIFLPRHEEMPWAVRAFFRHGAIGFKKWWLKDDAREHIVADCVKDVIHHMQVSKNITNVLYADEYLAAVMNWECTPAMDENLEINERNSPNWKADKALRKLINARSQTTLMEELVGTLKERIGVQEAEIDALDDKMGKLLTGSKDYKRNKNQLTQTRQAHKVEVVKLTNLSNKIREQTLAALRETIEETEERFESGQLPRPTPEFFIKRECEAVRKIGRLLANLKERFLPLALRDSFVVDTDAVNDRPAILGEILGMERRDPAVFLENIIPSKKKVNRVDLRVSPVIVLVPSAGLLAFSWNPRQKPEDGRLGIPTCFIRRRIRERQLTYLLSDFRWDTSKASAGMDLLTSDTLVAAFMTVRWDWRKRSREAREKGLVFNEQNDRTNWRRVYEAYIQTAADGGKKLFNRNYDFYERIIGKYFDLPEGVPLLRK